MWLLGSLRGRPLRREKRGQLCPLDWPMPEVSENVVHPPQGERGRRGDLDPYGATAPGVVDQQTGRTPRGTTSPVAWAPGKIVVGRKRLAAAVRLHPSTLPPHFQSRRVCEGRVKVIAGRVSGEPAPAIMARSPEGPTWRVLIASGED